MCRWATSRHMQKLIVARGKIVVTVVTTVLAAVVAGCGSMGAHCEGPTDHVYPGTCGDARVMVHPTDPGQFGLAFLDLPFSFICDTLVLPCDSIAYFARLNYEAKNKEVKAEK